MDVTTFDEYRREHQLLFEAMTAAMKRDLPPDIALALLTLDRDLIDEAIEELKTKQIIRRLALSKGPKPYHGSPKPVEILPVVRVERGLQIVPQQLPDNVVPIRDFQPRSPA